MGIELSGWLHTHKAIFCFVVGLHKLLYVNRVRHVQFPFICLSMGVRSVSHVFLHSLVKCFNPAQAFMKCMYFVSNIVTSRRDSLEQSTDTQYVDRMLDANIVCVSGTQHFRERDCWLEFVFRKAMLAAGLVNLANALDLCISVMFGPSDVKGCIFHSSLEVFNTHMYVRVGSALKNGFG